MRRLLLIYLTVCLASRWVSADPIDPDSSTRVVLGANDYLSAGADALRAAQYDDGIRYTLLGLQRGADNVRNRAAGLANLCAAYVAKSEPDQAIPYCTESLQLNAANWRAYSNRSQAYFLKGMFSEAQRDNEAAAALSPNAPHVRMIREKLNERTLQPQVIMEDHH